MKTTSNKPSQTKSENDSNAGRNHENQANANFRYAQDASQDMLRSNINQAEQSFRQAGQHMNRAGETIHRSTQAMSENLDMLSSAWAQLLLKQVQVLSQASLRVLECCFSSQFIEELANVQRRYAQESLENFRGISDKLDEAANRNEQQFRGNEQQSRNRAAGSR